MQRWQCPLRNMTPSSSCGGQKLSIHACLLESMQWWQCPVAETVALTAGLDTQDCPFRMTRQKLSIHACRPCCPPVECMGALNDSQRVTRVLYRVGLPNFGTSGHGCGTESFGANHTHGALSQCGTASFGANHTVLSASMRTATGSSIARLEPRVSRCTDDCVLSIVSLSRRRCTDDCVLAIVSLSRRSQCDTTCTPGLIEI